jgi:hypothetical protein
MVAVIREPIHPNTGIILRPSPVPPGFLPEPGGRLQDAELVTVWIDVKPVRARARDC